MRAHQVSYALLPSLFLAAFVLLASASPATAVTINYDDTTATSIQNLFVPGLDPRGYNVDFVRSSSALLYGGDFDFTTEEDARAAADAINLALNDDNIADEVAPSATTCDGIGGGVLCGTYGIGYELMGILTLTEGGSFITDNWVEVGDSFVTSDSRIYASFEVVPEPGTALLMGLGLTGLGVVGRSRRGASRPTA